MDELSRVFVEQNVCVVAVTQSKNVAAHRSNRNRSCVRKSEDGNNMI
jgi:hypothetical protein